jgi:hypothetical protein
MKTCSEIWVSYFRNLRQVYPDCSIRLDEIFRLVRSPLWEKDIAACRLDQSQKKELPCFTPTGLFFPRNSIGIVQYSGVICLDIDDVANVDSLKERCKSLPWVWCSYISPSGNGLKVFVRTMTDLEYYQRTEIEIAVKFYESTSFMRDIRAKDLPRLQFVSYDARIYVNESPLVFEKGSH